MTRTLVKTSVTLYCIRCARAVIFNAHYAIMLTWRYLMHNSSNIKCIPCHHRQREREREREMWIDLYFCFSLFDMYKKCTSLSVYTSMHHNKPAYLLDVILYRIRTESTLLLPAAYVDPDSFSSSGLLAIGRGGGIHLNIIFKEKSEY